MVSETAWEKANPVLLYDLIEEFRFSNAVLTGAETEFWPEEASRNIGGAYQTLRGEEASI